MSSFLFQVQKSCVSYCEVFLKYVERPSRTEWHASEVRWEEKYEDWIKFRWFDSFFVCCTNRKYFSWNAMLWEPKILSFGKIEIKPKFNFWLPSCVKIHIDATTEFVNQPSFPIIDYRACNCGPGWELISWWLLLKPHSCLPNYMCKILYAAKFPKYVLWHHTNIRWI